MGLLQNIEDNYKESFRSGNRAVTSILRILKTEFKNAQIEKMGKDITEEEAIQIVRRQIKQLEEAKDMFLKAGRTDLVENNEKEISIIEKYLPKMMEESKVREHVKKAFEEIGETADFGKLMSHAMKELKGKADGSVVGRVVKEVLENK